VEKAWELGLEIFTGVSYAFVTFSINGQGVHHNQVVKVGLGKRGLGQGINRNREAVAKVGFGIGFL